MSIKNLFYTEPLSVWFLMWGKWHYHIFFTGYHNCFSVSIWISSKNRYLKDKTFYTSRTKVFEMEKVFSFDIDDELDFEICESLYMKYI